MDGDESHMSTIYYIFNADNALDSTERQLCTHPITLCQLAVSMLPTGDANACSGSRSGAVVEGCILNSFHFDATDMQASCAEITVWIFSTRVGLWIP